MQFSLCFLLRSKIKNSERQSRKFFLSLTVLVVSGYFKKDTTTTAADKMARVLEAEAAATQEPTYPA